MTQPLIWCTLWVDSIDRPNWQKRVAESLRLSGVDKIQTDDRSGQVRIRYNPQVVTLFQLSAHLRSSGL